MMCMLHLETHNRSWFITYSIFNKNTNRYILDIYSFIPSNNYLIYFQICSQTYSDTSEEKNLPNLHSHLKFQVGSSHHFLSELYKLRFLEQTLLTAPSLNFPGLGELTKLRIARKLGAFGF